MPQIDERLLERLGAFVDGELSAADAVIIEALVEENPEIYDIVESLRQASEQIGRNFLVDISAHPLPIAWKHAVEQNSQPAIETAHPIPSNMAYRWINKKAVAGIAMAVLFLSIIWHSGFFLYGDVRPFDTGRLSISAGVAPAAATRTELEDDVVELRRALRRATDPVGLILTDHRLFGHHEQAAGTSRQALSAALKELWGHPTIPEFDRATFMTGRLVTITQKPAAHLVYKSGDGALWSLWVVPKMDLSHADSHPLGLDVWSSAKNSYVLIDVTDRSMVMKIKKFLENSE